MEQITKSALIDDLEKGLIDLYLGTVKVGRESRAFYRTVRGAADDPKGYKIVYVVV